MKAERVGSDGVEGVGVRRGIDLRVIVAKAEQLQRDGGNQEGGAGVGSERSEGGLGNGAVGGVGAGHAVNGASTGVMRGQGAAVGEGRAVTLEGAFPTSGAAPHPNQLLLSTSSLPFNSNLVDTSSPALADFNILDFLQSPQSAGVSPAVDMHSFYNHPNPSLPSTQPISVAQSISQNSNFLVAADLARSASHQPQLSLPNQNPVLARTHSLPSTFSQMSILSADGDLNEFTAQGIRAALLNNSPSASSPFNPDTPDSYTSSLDVPTVPIPFIVNPVHQVGQVNQVHHVGQVAPHPIAQRSNSQTFSTPNITIEHFPCAPAAQQTSFVSSEPTFSLPSPTPSTTIPVELSQPQLIYYQPSPTSTSRAGSPHSPNQPLLDNLETLSNASGSDLSEAESYLSGVSEGWFPLPMVFGEGATLAFDAMGNVGLAPVYSNAMYTHLSVPHKSPHHFHHRRLSDQSASSPNPALPVSGPGHHHQLAPHTVIPGPHLMHTSAGLLASSVNMAVNPVSLPPHAAMQMSAPMIHPSLVGTPEIPVVIRVPHPLIHTIPDPAGMTASGTSAGDSTWSSDPTTSVSLSAAGSPSLKPSAPSAEPPDSRPPVPVLRKARSTPVPTPSSSPPHDGGSSSTLRPPPASSIRPILIKRSPNARPEDADEGEARTGPHARKAGGGTLYGCPFEGCGKTFTRPYNLKSHYRSHTGERPFCCEYCTATFSRKHDLRRHEKLHSGIKPHRCEACGKDFARSDALGRHLKAEPGKESPCATRVKLLRQREAIMASVKGHAAGESGHGMMGGLVGVGETQWEFGWDGNGDEVGDMDLGEGGADIEMDE